MRRTWAPRGHTPVLRHRQGNRPKLSMAAMCCYRPDGSAAELVWGLRDGSYDTDALIGLLKRLKVHLQDAPITLVWDNLPAHRSAAMRAWVAGQGGWARVEYLPGYAPDLNPAEGVWSNLKGGELANRACQSAAEVRGVAWCGLARIRDQAGLLWSFLRHAGLALNTTE